MNVALEPLGSQRTGASPGARYSWLHSHSQDVHGAFTRPLRPSWDALLPSTKYCRVFGGVLEPRYIVGAEPLDQ